MLPIEGRDELPPKHAGASHLDARRFGALELIEVAFPDAFIGPEQPVIRAKRVCQRPVVKRLHHVVGTIVAAPSLDAAKMAA
jgi:hypothetical protein